MSLNSVLVESLKGLPKELIVLIVACLPLSELRGAIPLALYWNFSPFKALLLGILGNILPIVPLLLFLGNVSKRLMRFKVFGKFFEWLLSSTERKAKLVQRYSFLGLILFVAIPFPMTGAWTGAVASCLFGLKFKSAFVGILLGVIIAGILVLSFCTLGIISINLFLK